MPVKVEAPFTRHFHCTFPFAMGLAELGAGSAAGEANAPVNGTKSNLPAPAAGAVVMVIAPVAGSISIELMLLVAPLQTKSAL